jgi:hypothetical protein
MSNRTVPFFNTYIKLLKKHACKITKQPIFLLHLTIRQKVVVKIPAWPFYIYKKIQKNSMMLPAALLVVKRPENEVDRSAQFTYFETKRV